MYLQSPGPVLFSRGFLTIRWYGVMIASGFLVATIFASRKAQSWQIDPEKLVNAALCSFVGGIIGARLYFVALTWQNFVNQPLEIFAMWNGGLSIHGGWIGAVVAMFVYCKFAKLPILTTFDLVACATPLAQSIGRWGNFFNSELFGTPVGRDFPLRLYIAPGHRPARYITSDFFHPTFLYESVWDLLLFLALYLFVADRLRKYPGMTVGVYVIGYSIGRLLVEPLRTDSIMMGDVQVPMLASAVALLLALIWLSFLKWRYENQKQKEKSAAD